MGTWSILSRAGYAQDVRGSEGALFPTIHALLDKRWPGCKIVPVKPYRWTVKGPRGKVFASLTYRESE